MTFDQFEKHLAAVEEPVVLIEGRRSIDDGHAEKARALGAMLARRFQHLHFRSGNADGSDAAFSAGVAEVDPSRLQIVMPYATHKKSTRYDEASYESPETLTAEREDAIIRETLTASPKAKGLVALRGKPGRLGAKAAYLIRDTMKVLGDGEDLARPVVALFYIDPENPDEGGTGHTIRVCRQQGVPVVFQDAWMAWLP